MRSIAITGALLVGIATNLMAVPSPDEPKPPEPTAEQLAKAAEPKPTEPTGEQLAAAKEAYAKHGAIYEASTDPAMKKEFLTTHVFHFTGKTADVDLKDLPDLPFYFALSFHSPEVTDAGAKALRRLTNLTYPSLGRTKVTDEGMKELRNLKNLRKLNLSYTKVTDKGFKELKELKGLKLLILETVSKPL